MHIGYSSVADNTGLSSFVVWPLSATKSAKSREIPREFEARHPRSSILVSIESAYATSYISQSSNFGRICYRFRDIDVKS